MKSLCPNAELRQKMKENMLFLQNLENNTYEDKPIKKNPPSKMTANEFSTL